MKKDINREISLKIPKNLPIPISENTVPLLTAHGCILIERFTGKNFIYTAFNFKTGRREVIDKRTTPLTISGVDVMVEKMRLSNVAGAGRLEADRQAGDNATIDNCRDILTAAFKEALPKYGYTVRDEQLALSSHILEAIGKRKITLAEAEVGTGKTLAYLIPSIIAKRGRLGGNLNMSYHTGTPYVELAHMPILVATSSIALQTALVNDYIPELSRMLLESGIIKTPLTAVIRKGREHYVCRRKLISHIRNEHDDNTRTILEKLLLPDAPIDLAMVDGLQPHIRQKVSVPSRCAISCPYKRGCPYLNFREYVQTAEIDIQVCNHNYLLADTLKRRDDKAPLIPNYQILVIDEAHKFLQAAQSMYGVEFSSLSTDEIKSISDCLKFKYGKTKKLMATASSKLVDESNKLFRKLMQHAPKDDLECEDEPERFAAIIDNPSERCLRNIRDISEEIAKKLAISELTGKYAGVKAQLLQGLEGIQSRANALLKHKNLICWLEKIENGYKLCAIPKDLDRRLHDDLWDKGMPTILTSGTLSAGGDFSRIKKSLGICHINSLRVMETSKRSPFNYSENALLYLSKGIPFPDRRKTEYIDAIADEVERLVRASHGHAAVLFTSYSVMDMVWKLLKERSLPYQMFRLGKGAIQEIEGFKNSGNGILFAAGALWEGIDIPGDALSMVIIVKLPFPQPDPINEYERTLYDSERDFKDNVIIPDMLIKTLQGSGRGVRTETDTCVIAICDCRVDENGAYRGIVLSALPDYPVTDSISEVESFFDEKKTKKYFN
ncbi:MAG: ATP-dependent DNA helicase [Oscillospiraceae bacterium]|nr:ATP-dependent DNA helicase [Oscillospiraceae bacterium]MCL2279525.1 ATP-dependent DNA helicase [Oscillospiraceae bacterium]